MSRDPQFKLQYSVLGAHGPAVPLAWWPGTNAWVFRVTEGLTYYKAPEAELVMAHGGRVRSCMQVAGQVVTPIHTFVSQSSTQDPSSPHPEQAARWRWLVDTTADPLWTDNWRLREQLERASSSPGQLLVDPVQIEAYQLLGMAAPFWWPEQEWRTWLGVALEEGLVQTVMPTKPGTRIHDT